MSAPADTVSPVPAESRQAASRRPRLLFSGYYGLGNAGDEAVLAGLLEGMRQIGLEADVTVLSATPRQTVEWHGVKALPRMKPPLLRAVAWCDVLVSGGGSLLQDVTSFASLGYYLGVMVLAKTLRKKVVIAAQGMGPLNQPRSRRWVGRILNRTDLITVRDVDSAELLRSCGVRRPVHITADPAFLLTSFPAGGAQKPPVRVGLALRTWKDRDAAAWGSELCEELLKREAQPFLLPMHEPSDRALAEKIQKNVGSKIEVAPTPQKVEDVLRSIRSCHVMVGMRLHALLLAAGMGIPVLAWSYDPKVDALMHQIEFEEGLLPFDSAPGACAETALQAAKKTVDRDRIARLRADALKTLALLSEVV
jgi:polysaccharide pyruvyl transferase CsaB